MLATSRARADLERSLARRSSRSELVDQEKRGRHARQQGDDRQHLEDALPAQRDGEPWRRPCRPATPPNR